MEILLSKLDFSHVELSNSGNLVLSVNDSRGLALSLGEDDINEIFRRRNNRDPFEV